MQRSGTEVPDARCRRELYLSNAHTSRKQSRLVVVSFSRGTSDESGGVFCINEKWGTAEGLDFTKPGWDDQDIR